MKGDFSRFTFDPAKRYTRVLKQQGRVDLDADWNELNDILDGLDRKTRIDVIGECGVPIDAAGFVIALNGAGTDLTVSAGRFYAHGLLVELPAATTYLTQPFLLTPPALNPVDGRIDLVLLDVWERHITAIEDPSIREVALGGPDTTTRVQTIFQVRITQGVGGVTCDTAPTPGPSGGLMLASVVPVPPSDDLCAIAPTGGYRGLENRLYRVEVHDSTASGQATFKWSRDNGSIAFSVTEFPTGQPTKVRVSRIGRDQVLTFRFGDWVEVIGDQSELAGVPGTLAQITGIDEANRELTLSKNVSAHAAETHPKVRRWDQPSDAIPIGAGPVVLEDGVQIEFSGTDFLTGDYWTFPVRTATGNIEFPSTPQPPEGIEHFYCPLALVTWHVVGGVVTADIVICPGKFPPLITPRSACCCCTVTAGLGGDHPNIQAALTAVAGVAGPVRICLRPGTHNVSATLVINRNDVTIEGCGAHAKVIGQGGANPVFNVDSVSGTAFEHIWIEGEGGDFVPIQARRATDLRIEGSHLDTDGGPAAMRLQSDGLEIVGNEIVGGGIHVTDGSARVSIRGNTITDGAGAGVALGGIVAGIGVIDDRTGVVAVRILDNVIAEMDNSGVTTALEGQEGAGEIEDVTIVGNRIAGCARQPAASPFNSVAVGGVVMQQSHHVRVRENHIVDNGAGENVPACGAYFTNCSALEIDDNHIEANGVATDQRQCIEFNQMEPQQLLPNPLRFGNLSFEVFDFNDNPVPNNQISPAQGINGLDLNNRTLILLPVVVSSVEMAVAFTGSGTRTVTARRADGTIVATQSVSPDAGGPVQQLVLSGAGIVRVDVLAPPSEMFLTEFCFSAATPGESSFQGGIIAIGAFPETFAVPSGDAGLLLAPRGDPSVAVRGNTVVCPSGQPLFLFGIGAMFVSDNSLTSTAFRLNPFRDFPQPIAIVNFGPSYFLAGTAPSFGSIINQNLTAQPPPPDRVLTTQGVLFDGRILFENNQVTFKPRVTPPPAIGTTCYLSTFDDVAVTGNQFVTEQSVVMLTQLWAFGFSARVTGNRFSEVPLTAFFSSMALGQQAMTSLDQATHCLFTYGVDRLHQNNQVSINGACEQLTSLYDNIMGAQ